MINGEGGRTGGEGEGEGEIPTQCERGIIVEDRVMWIMYTKC